MNACMIVGWLYCFNIQSCCPAMLNLCLVLAMSYFIFLLCSFGGYNIPCNSYFDINTVEIMSVPLSCRTTLAISVYETLHWPCYKMSFIVVKKQIQYNKCTTQSFININIFQYKCVSLSQLSCSNSTYFKATVELTLLIQVELVL